MPCPFPRSTLLSWTPTVIIMIIDILSLLTLLLSLLPSLSSSVILSLNIIWSIIWNIVILRNLLSFWSFENYLSIRNLESCEILNVVVQRKDQTESKNLSSFFSNITDSLNFKVLWAYLGVVDQTAWKNWMNLLTKCSL